MSLNIILYMGGYGSGLTHLRSIFSLSDFHDSWMPMIKAVIWLQNSENSGIYRDMFFNSQTKFIYPLSSLLLVHDIYRMTDNSVFVMLHIISIISVFVTVGAVAWVGIIVYDRVTTLRTKQERYVIAILIGIATMTFYPIIKALSLGQIQTWINALFALACVAWLLDKKIVSGILIGLICLIKPQLSLFFIWALLRHQWSFAFAWVIIVGIGEALAIVSYGIDNNIEYISVLRFISQHGESYYPNQSINGMINRLIHNGNSLSWDSNIYPDYNRIVYVSTIVSSFMLVTFSLVWRRTSHNASSIIDFCCAATSFTIASPVAWEHHYGIMPILFVAAFFCITLLPSNRKRIYLYVLLVCYVCAASYITIAQKTAPYLINVVQSYLLLSALSVLVIGQIMRYFCLDVSLIATPNNDLDTLNNDKKYGDCPQLPGPTGLRADDHDRLRDDASTPDMALRAVPVGDEGA